MITRILPFLWLFHGIIANAALVAPIQPSSRLPTTSEPGDQSFLAILAIHRKGDHPKPTPFTIDTGATLPLYPCSKPTLANTSFTLSTTTGPPVVLRKIQVACAPVRIAGLGPAESALHAQLARAAGLPLTFSYCLPSAGYGALFFGATSYRFGASGRGFKILKLGLSRLRASSGFYSARVASIELGGVRIALDRDALFGTHRRYTALPDASYRALRDRLVAQSNVSRANARFGALDLCYRIDSAAAMESLPTIRLAFAGGFVWEIGAANYLVPTREPGLFCVGIVNGGEDSTPAIGTFQQQDHVLEFNLAKKTLGISKSLVGMGGNCADLLTPMVN
ncbi:hypothetical protein SELMODRAFT_403740 [Selaginella moellendorffii]|uniref:Peptidase A1 domain-containing protein n=1 Tax=Selaginella moellendorffii TaxID=88036 RepID=D8QSD6_SELML|nr:basic 7S globulin 2 [Selaginella moellendorffii]EFJ37415.1 hypothetical protein SELMODRAFT_403740 [Selaginella moellendorffii]|eukprot:XP_002962155.1 basic 7S globulin 2 [Selaginella moellendorffii]